MGLFDFLKKANAPAVCPVGSVAPVNDTGFPSVDDKGCRLLEVYKMEVVNARGKDADIAKTKTERLRVGDSLVLEVNPKAEMSVNVIYDGVRIGWLKNGADLDSHKWLFDVWDRLSCGATVRATVVEKTINKNGSYRVLVNVARYAK